MDLRQMEVAVAVADAGGFSAAARRLHVVQSAVSGTVKALEAEVGGKLFERTTHRVRPTSLGEAFLPAARAALVSARQVEEAVQRAHGQLRGRLRIGVMQGLHTGLDRALAALRNRHPGVTVELRQGPSEEIVRATRDGGLDLAIVALDRPQSGLVVRPLLEEKMVLATAVDCEVQQRTPLTLSEVAAVQLVDFSPGWAIRSAVDRAFAIAGIERTPSFEVNDVLTATDLVRQNLAVCILPASVAARFEDLRFRTFADPAPQWTVMVVHPEGELSPTVSALLDALG